MLVKKQHLNTSGLTLVWEDDISVDSPDSCVVYRRRTIGMSYGFIASATAMQAVPVLPVTQHLS